MEPASERDVLAISVNRMIDTPREVSRQADVISSGDYSTGILPRSAQDILGSALQRMTATLRENAEEAALREWIRNGQRKIHDATRGAVEEDELGARLIRALAKHLNAQRGAFYVYREDLGRLQFLSGYASGDECADFGLGEGLVGQVAQDRNPIHIDRVPEGYCTIRSALGETTPHHLVLFPLVHDDRLLGVFELASVTSFNDRFLSFISSVRENICIALMVAQGQAELKRLFEHTKQQAIFFRVFKDATDPIVLEDLSGRVMDLNGAAEAAYGWRKEDLIGKSIKLIPFFENRAAW